MHLHDQRHATATNLYELTGDAPLVSTVLGHTLGGNNATMSYIRIKLPHVRHGMEKYWAAIQEELNKAR